MSILMDSKEDLCNERHDQSRNCPKLLRGNLEGQADIFGRTEAIVKFLMKPAFRVMAVPRPNLIAENREADMAFREYKPIDHNKKMIEKLRAMRQDKSLQVRNDSCKDQD